MGCWSHTLCCLAVCSCVTHMVLLLKPVHQPVVAHYHRPTVLLCWVLWWQVHVPAETTVFSFMYSYQRDPEYWPAAQEFKPERWLPVSDTDVACWNCRPTSWNSVVVLLLTSVRVTTCSAALSCELASIKLWPLCSAHTMHLSSSGARAHTYAFVSLQQQLRCGLS